MQTGENSPPRTQTGAGGSGVWRRPVRGRGAPAAGPALVTLTTPCLSHHHLLLSPQNPSSGPAVGTLPSPAHRIGAPQKKALTFTKWLQLLTQDQHQPWGARAVGHHHLSLSCLYCPFLQVCATSHLPWEQQGRSPCLSEVQSWTFPAGGISTPLHQACSGSSIPGDWLVVPCGRDCCTGSLKQRLINECLHSTLKVWRAI